MGGTSSFISILCLTGFLGTAWFATKISKLIGVSSIILEISTGIILGPNVLKFVPAEYSVCSAKRDQTCALPPDFEFRLQHNVLGDGVGKVYAKGLCPREHYRHEVDQAEGQGEGSIPEHVSEVPPEVLELPESARSEVPNGDAAAFGGHRRLSGGGEHYSTIEECLVETCQSMVSRDCLLYPAFLSIVGHAGVALMIFESGMHFDFGRAGKVAPKSAVVAVFGTAFPLISGALLTLAFGKPFVPDGLAVGTALAPTSIGIALRLLTEAGALHEDFGQATITAAFIIDILALILLNILFNISGNFDAMAVVGKPLIGITFLALAMVAAVKVWPKVINEWIMPRVKEREGAKVSRKDEVLFLIMMMVLVLYASITFFLGTHLWGCFTAGMTFTCLSKDHHAHHVWVRQTKRVTTWMIRIFFSAAVAFSIPITKLFSLEAFWKGTLMGLGPCIFMKFLCAPHMGESRWVIGAAMVGRAEFAYLVAQMAVAADMIDHDTYSIVIWALLYATIFAPLLFRKLLNRYMAKYRAAQAGDIEDGAVVPTPDALAAHKIKDSADVSVDGGPIAGELKAMVDIYADGCALACEVKDTTEAGQTLLGGGLHCRGCRCDHSAAIRADAVVVGGVSAAKAKDIVRKMKAEGFKNVATGNVVNGALALKLQEALGAADIALKVQAEG